MTLGHPALRWLWRAKLVGAWRKQRRRLKTPSGVALALVGLLLIGLWIFSLVVPAFVPGNVRTPISRAGAQVGLALLFAVSVSTALGHRGLYVPPGEIERLLSAPVSRAELIRHRLFAAMGRSLLGACVFGLVVMRHAQVPLFGFLGTLVAALTLPISAQGVSLLAGDAENRFYARLSRLPRGAFNLVALLALAAGVLAFSLSGRGGRNRFGRWIEELGAGDVKQWLEHPVARVLLAPFEPWARAVTAPDVATFAPWLALTLVIAFVAFELVTRLRVDFRELSLATAADVARRLNRLRRGVIGAGAADAPRASAGWRAPWLFGRGPFGAISWRKSAALVRKARTALLAGALIVAALTVASVVWIDRSRHGALLGTLLVCLVGTPYLCSALRFDFREDLDQMAVIKAWPVAPWRVFLATLVPQALVVASFIVAGVLARAAVTGAVPAFLPACVAAVPLVVLVWIAIDNAAFLFAPVRLIPGQEGALQNAGRALLLTLLKMLAFGCALGGASLVAVLVRWPIDPGDARTVALAGGLSLVALAVELGLLVWLGGALLRRFDVARDRG